MKANMLEYLEETAARFPDKIAFYDDRDSLTFAALEKTARRIGSCLAETTLACAPVALHWIPAVSVTFQPYMECCTRAAPMRHWISPCLLNVCGCCWSCWPLP